MVILFVAYFCPEDLQIPKISSVDSRHELEGFILYNNRLDKEYERFMTTLNRTIVDKSKESSVPMRWEEKGLGTFHLVIIFNY